MKKVRVLAGLLCLMMILTAMPMLQVSAATAGFTLDTIFADWGGYYVREQLNLSGTIKEGTYDEWIAKEGLVFTDASGAAATPVYDTTNKALAGTKWSNPVGTNFRWNNGTQYNQATWYPLADSAVVITCYPRQSANMILEVGFGKNQGAWIAMSKSAIQAKYTNASGGTGWTAAESWGDPWWRTIMIVPEETGYRVYYKGADGAGSADNLEDDRTWTQAFDEVIPYANVAPGVQVTDFQLLSSVRILEKPRATFTSAQVMGVDKKQSMIEFKDSTVPSADVVAVDETNGTVTFDETNGMKLSGGSATWKGASYPISNSSGLLFKAKLGAGEELVFSLGANFGSGNRKQAQFYLTNQYAAAIGSGTWTASSYVPGHEWVDYYITTRDQDAGYCVYAKRETEENWSLIQEVTGYKNSNVNPSNVLVSGSGSVKLLSKVTNFDGKKMLMLDYTGAIMKEDGTATIPVGTTFTATMAPSVTAGKLVFASYTGEGAAAELANVAIYDVADLVNGQQAYTPVAGATKTKVFLWDDFTKLTPLSSVKAITLVAAE